MPGPIGHSSSHRLRHALVLESMAGVVLQHLGCARGIGQDLPQVVPREGGQAGLRVSPDLLLGIVQEVEMEPREHAS